MNIYKTKGIIRFKIIFIDLNNFKEINSTEQFNIDVKHIILESSIVIQDDNSLLLYDIHSLEFIGRKFLKNNDNVFKYDNQHLIIIYEKEVKIRLYIYKYKNKDFIKFCKIKINLPIDKIYGWKTYKDKRFEHRVLFRLIDKRIIIFYKNKINILNINSE